MCSPACQQRYLSFNAGYKLEKSEHFVSRDMSPSGPINKNKSPSLMNRQTKDSNDSIIKQIKYQTQYNVPVKFSSMFSQKNRNESL